MNVADFHAWQECHCYCTPQEACTVQSHKEKENNIIIESTNLKKTDDGKSLIFFMSVEMPSYMNEQQVVDLFEGNCSVLSH